MISEPLQQVVAIVAATVQQTLVSAGVGGVSADRGGSGRRKRSKRKTSCAKFFCFKIAPWRGTQLSASCGWGSEESGGRCQIWYKMEMKRFKPETLLDRSDECSEQTLLLLRKAELAPAPRFSLCFGRNA